MSNTKITKTQKYDMLLAIAEVKENQLLVDFINAEKEQLAKRNAYKSKTKDKNKVDYSDLFKEHLVPKTMYTVSEIIKTIPEFEGFTTQKVSPICKVLVDENVLERIEDKKKTLYALAEEG